ncbi:MAG: hypothetical protein QOI95_4329 [Acidimicrobiaceae bacterium]|jgi:hypothetical protein
MFVQVIEGKTNDPSAIIEQGDRWQREVRPGAIGYLGVTAGVTADGQSVAIVRFEDEAAARANAGRPEQTAWFEGMAKLYDGEPTFTESSDVTEWMGGGSNDAGFVQVMRSTGVDRSQVEKMDAAFEPFAAQRPDLLGGLRIWTGADSCIDVAYFTTVEEARKGEQAELPDEMKELMGEFAGGMGETTYLDLTAPQLH